MATYKIVNPGEGWPAVTQTGTYATSAGVVPPLRFGQVVQAVDASFGMGEFMFVSGSNATAGNLVRINGVNGGAIVAGSATLTAGPLGFAMADMSATNVWGFVQIRGVFDSASHSDAAANGAALKMGAADGAIDVRSASNDTYEIFGAYNASSNTASNAASVMLDFPHWNAYET
jgi:hypothetical protein